MQGKTSDLDRNGQKIRLRIHPGKNKIMKARSKVNKQVTIQEKEVEEVASYTYLGSKITPNGDSETEVNARLSKARHAFARLRRVWNAKNISTNTKVRIFKTDVLSIL